MSCWSRLSPSSPEFCRNCLLDELACGAISFLPFVLYRMALGGFLLVLVYGYGAICRRAGGLAALAEPASQRCRRRMIAQGW